MTLLVVPIGATGVLICDVVLGEGVVDGIDVVLFAFGGLSALTLAASLVAGVVLVSAFGTIFCCAINGRTERTQVNASNKEKAGHLLPKLQECKCIRVQAIMRLDIDNSNT
ncbi:MAG TPA: hypothetical protein V6C97_20355 [Oculatellaceae cyanobacterium]